MKTIMVACIIQFGSYGQRYVTGSLVKDKGETLIVDIHHSMTEILRIDDIDYSVYKISKDDCVIGKTALEAAKHSLIHPAGVE